MLFRSPLGGAGVAYWAPIAERYGLDIEVVNSTVDPTFRFMPLDWDGRIRMDCSSPSAMASLVARMDGDEATFDLATGNDADADRHGIVTPDGLMNPNHFLAVAIEHLFGGARPGNNLFAETIICLDAKTGKRVWHFQTLHHGLWDYDLPAAPVLTDIRVGGRTIKALAQVTKQAYTFVLDRTNGKPVFPIDERAVPQGEVPGEWYSPTQPIPSKPPAFDQQGVTDNNLLDYTPELKAAAKKIVDDYNYGPVYTPPEVVDTDKGKKIGRAHV